MSQDYLKVNGSKEREIIGQNYFDELVKRSFFQDVEVDLPEYGNIRCKIHDFVHDFLQYVTNNEYLNFDSKLEPNSDEEVPYDKVHHLTLMDPVTGYSMHRILPNCKRLRTIRAIDGSHYSIDLIFQLIVELKSLRTLALCSVSNDIPYAIDVTLEIPKMIGGLIHLRYLDLSGNGELKELPSVMGSLYNLQTLKLVGCWGLEEIDVGRLINLRHLYVNKCSERVLIKGIEKLKHMQTLDWFPVVRCYDMDEGNKWEQLKDVNQLQGSLSIYMKHSRKMAKNAAVMVNKSRLLELKLEFYWNVAEEREIMNGLEPHPCLESLSIDGYGGDAFSDWFSSLHCLRVLSLIACRHYARSSLKGRS
uniref:putative disease resistance RPP13-like protein 1 n=1 Tax=Fragaria vesca subsp. vesca TaxID=101020 RepID=UPI0005C8D57A|nr:PREDICTED: putative disease resistance RPP13-like protein 1 [Fragaria vesca subsp. vesca]